MFSSPVLGETDEFPGNYNVDGTGVLGDTDAFIGREGRLLQAESTPFLVCALLVNPDRVHPYSLSSRSLEFSASIF